MKNGAPEEKVAVVHHAVDLTMYEKISENKMAMRKKLELPEESFIVLHAGNLYSWKKPEIVIDALEFTKSFDVHFCNVGEIEEKQRLVEYAREKKVKNFLFHHRVSPATVPSYLKAADALVLLPAPKS